MLNDIMKPVIGATVSLLIVLGIMVSIDVVWEHFYPTEQSSSFVGYSQSCWQVGDSLHVVTAKGDTLRWDISRLEGEQ